VSIHKHRKPQPPYHPPNGAIQKKYLLDTFSLESIRSQKAGQEEINKAHWAWYSSLAYQRSLILSDLKNALSEAASQPLDFAGYQRAVKYKWGLDPLSARGSLSIPGGRFNIGEIDQMFPPFPALYLGEDKATVLQEMYQVEPQGRNGLTPDEISLTRPDSVTIVSVYGSLENIIDLEKPDRLKPFVDLIKNFNIPREAMHLAHKLGKTPANVSNVTLLLKSLLESNWRAYPMHVNLPANSQIFGQLVMEAGIEGIKYPSKYQGKSCLAIFPQNFVGSDSFVELVDQAPPGVVRKRLDSKTIHNLF
jgi:hypothetical protein